MAKSELKIGLLGGTFDPPHLGHLRVAEEVRLAFHLKEVWFIPAGYPPHKGIPFFSFEERFKMLDLATSSNPYFKVLDLEREERPSYTLKTLEKLKGLYPEREFFLIVGFDAFTELETWWHFEKFLDYCEIIVVSRGSGDWKKGKLEVEERAQILWGEKGKKKVHFLEIFPYEISSTLLRDYLKKGRSIRYLIPEEVYFYLKERGYLSV
jgi:nicotinate-nucleotide adenylyltransferase